MKLPIFRLLFLLIVLPMGLFSCKKDSPEPTNTDLVVAHEWHGKSVMANGMDVSEMPQVKDMLLDIKSTRLTLRRDGTYTAVFEQAGSTQTNTGTWSFKENETILFIDVLGELTIKELNTREMILLKEITNQGVTIKAEVTFVKNN